MENQAPEIIAPQQPKSNLILWAVIGITILAAGVGIGLIAGKYSSPVDNNQKQVQKTDIPVTSPSVAPTETADPTANWKTYTNPQYGYSFKYPSTWKNATDPYAVENGNLEFRLQTNNNEFVNGTVFNGKADTSNDLSWSKRISLNNDKSLLITYTDNLGPGSKGGSIDIGIFDQILSTFKFTTVKCTGVCPQLMPPAPNFCTNGTIISGGANECGCQLGPTCESFTCPQTAWVNCMPGPNAPQNPQCTTDYYSWAKKNCPNFQGIAR